MFPKAVQGLRRVHGPDDLSREHYFTAGFRDAATKFVVVSEHLGERCEAADFANPCFCSSNRCAQREMHALHPVRHENARKKVTGGTNRFQSRAEIVFGNACVERSDGAGVSRSEWRNHFAQEVWANAN